MGSEKTTTFINHMKNSNERFIYVTPFLEECKRVVDEIDSFKLPFYIKGKKANGLKHLLNKGYNVSITHALFSSLDDDTKNLIKSMGYILVLDEVINVVQKYTGMTKNDLDTFYREYGYLDEHGYLCWDDCKVDSSKYAVGSKFYDVLLLCKNRNLLTVNGKTILLIDADMRKGKVAQYLGLNKSPGLSFS